MPDDEDESDCSDSFEGDRLHLGTQAPIRSDENGGHAVTQMESNRRGMTVARVCGLAQQRDDEILESWPIRNPRTLTPQLT